MTDRGKPSNPSTLKTATYLRNLFEERGITISEAARRAEVDKGSLFAVLDGRLSLSRNMAIKIGLAMKLDPPTLVYTMYAEERAQETLAQLSLQFKRPSCR